MLEVVLTRLAPVSQAKSCPLGGEWNRSRMPLNDEFGSDRHEAGSMSLLFGESASARPEICQARYVPRISSEDPEPRCLI